MIELTFVSGERAGRSWTARRFPVRIGREASAELQIEEPGIWDRHLQIDLNPTEGFVLSVAPSALAAVNGQAVEQAILRNGDVIELGAVKLQFWLAPARQAGLRIREWLTWAAIAALSLGQVWLIYWLLG